jgi:hypothetical protein
MHKHHNSQYCNIVSKNIEIYRHTKFRTSSCSFPLITAVRLKAKWKFLCGHHILYYTKKKYRNKSFIFGKVYCHILFQDSILSETGIAPTSQIHVSALLLLLIVGSRNSVGCPPVSNIHTTFFELVNLLGNTQAAW